MSYVISKHQNLQVSPDFTIGWDGPKKNHPSLDCVWTMRGKRATLIMKGYEDVPVPLCHFQLSKRTAEAHGLYGRVVRWTYGVLEVPG